MVSEVWLIVEASGPVQLHRSAIVTVLPVLAASAGEPGSDGDAHRTPDGE